MKAQTHFDEIALEIYVFSCGNGDTILVHFPGDKWVLVDCNLEKKNGTYDRFFKFLMEQGIKRLSYIFQTHPDYDHFRGMDKVLRYFTSEGRSIGVYCDTGFSADMAIELLNGGESRYRELQELLDELQKDDLVQFSYVSDQHRDIDLGGYGNSIGFRPIAPNAGLSRKITRKYLRGLARLQRKPERNALSIVLVLRANAGDTSFNALLAADVGEKEIVPALEAWDAREGLGTGEGTFSCVKVPHHGALSSHSMEICRRRTQVPGRDAVSVISADVSRRGFPNRIVVSDYLDNDWSVLVTSKHVRISPKNSPRELFDRSEQAETQVANNDIRIWWTPSQGVKWEPLESAVRHEDLELFDTRG